MTVPTPSVGQVIDAAAWGAVVATDVNGLLGRATTLEGQIAPLLAGLIGTNARTPLSYAGGLTSSAWTQCGAVSIPAVAYPRIAFMSASVLVYKSAGTAVHYQLGIDTPLGFVGEDHATQASFTESASVSAVATLPANVAGTATARLLTATDTATVTTSGWFAGFNYLDILLVGVRDIGAIIEP